MSFYVYTLDEYLYGNKYNLISIQISVVGGTVLIIGVVFYLDGFLTLYKIIQEWWEKRQRKIKEE
jgi:hypothetical protein